MHTPEAIDLIPALPQVIQRPTVEIPEEVEAGYLVRGVVGWSENQDHA